PAAHTLEGALPGAVPRRAVPPLLQERLPERPSRVPAQRRARDGGRGGVPAARRPGGADPRAARRRRARGARRHPSRRRRVTVYTLGINAVYHDSSACLVRDGEVVAAAEDERFT